MEGTGYRCCATTGENRCALSATHWTWGSGRARSNRDSSRWRKQSWLGRFVSTYGWRAYALPVLMAVTAVVIYQTVTGTSVPAPASGDPVQGPPKIGAVGTSIIDAPPRGLTQFDANLPTGMLPNGGPYTDAGNKTWHVVPGSHAQIGQGTAKVFKYTVEVENGVDTTAFGGDDAFARDGRPDAGQPQELDAQPAIRVHQDRRRR